MKLALENAPPSGRVSAEHVLNVLGRFNVVLAPENAATSLQILTPPLAKTARYGSLRSTDDAQDIDHE